jgi:hypothetical protein
LSNLHELEVNLTLVLVSFFPTFDCFSFLRLFLVMSFLFPVFESSDTSNSAPASISSFLSSSPKPPIPHFVIMSSLATSSSGSTSLAIAGGGNPPPSNRAECGTVNSAVSMDDTAEKATSVWDFTHIQKHGTTRADQTWTCLWCNMTFKHWNATKVLYHLVKVEKKDIRTCRANHDAKHKELYRSVLNDKDKSQASFDVRAAKFQSLVGEGQQSLAVMFEAGRQRMSHGGGGGTTGTTAESANGTRAGGCVDLTIEASTASQLTMSIADFIHSSGLSFSATQGQHFQNILKFARGVPSTYKPPTRNSIATTLLKINYSRRIEK